MERKSIIQEYFILSASEKGNLSSSAKTGIVASGITDLVENDICEKDGKKLIVKNKLPNKFNHLTSLYEYLSEKPRSIDKIMDDYCMSMTDKRIQKLLVDTGESLLTENIVTKEKGGLLGNKEVYSPESMYKESLIATLKESITQKEELSIHDMALVSILQETQKLKQYFSKYEANTLKEKLKLMRKDPNNKALKEMIDYVDSMTAAMVACIVVIAN